MFKNAYSANKNAPYSFKFFHDQLLLTNDEIKIKKRDKILAEENLAVSKSAHYPKLDLKIGASGGSEQEASSSSADPSGEAGKIGLSGGSGGSSNYKVNTDSISGSLGLNYNIFSKFATRNSVLNARNGVNQKILERALLLDRKKKELIHVLIEIQALLKRGISRYNLNKFDLALEDFNELLFKDPSIIEAYRYRAEIYLINGKKQLAKKDLNQVLLSDKTIPEIYLLRGISKRV